MSDPISRPERTTSSPSCDTLDRRGFLRLAGAGAAACGAAPLALAMPVAPGQRGFYGEPARWDEEFDVIVIGSGFAGLAAAGEAASRGAKVVVLEKMPIAGGNSVINGGGYNAWTDNRKMREKLGLGEDSAELHLKDSLKGGDFFNIPELTKTVIDGSPDALNWMLDEGDLQLKNVLARIGGHSAYRDHISLNGSGSAFIDALKKINQTKGVGKVRTNSPVSRLWRKDSFSPVLGVEISTRKGLRNIRANRAVIVASGGFGRDISMRQLYCPNLTEAYNSTNQPGATGEMIRYAQAIGADTLHLAFIQLYPTADPDGGILDKYALYPSRTPSYGGVFVATNGKRFVSELERRDVVARAEIGTGADRAFCLFTEKMIPKVTTQEEVNAGMRAGRVWKADTLDELAKRMGLPSAEVVSTIEKHNEYLKAGKDPQFNKPFTKVMMAFDGGPYYGVAQWPSVHHTMGGLRINPKAQVIDIFGAPILGLYAAGEATGGVHGNNRLGANAIPDAVVFGRVAGASAAKTVKA